MIKGGLFALPAHPLTCMNVSGLHSSVPSSSCFRSSMVVVSPPFMLLSVACRSGGGVQGRAGMAQAMSCWTQLTC